MDTISRNTRLPYFHPEYRHPDVSEVRALLKSQRWTGARVAALTGVIDRSVRRWTGGDADIPYSAWRLLLIYAGLDLNN